MKLYQAKTNNIPFYVLPSAIRHTPCSKQNTSQYGNSHLLSQVDFSLWELCTKTCIVKRYWDMIIWSAFCYSAGSDKSEHKKAVSHRRLKRAAMITMAL